MPMVPAVMRHPAAVAWLLVGVVAFAASVMVYRQIVLSEPRLWTHLDEGVYRAAGTLARQHPADLYRVRMGEPGQEQLRFTYPPFAALLFAAASPFSFGIWQIALVVTDLILLPAITCASLRVSGLGAVGFGLLGDSRRSELGSSGRTGLAGAGFALLMAAVGLWLEPVYMTMFYGQINLILLALIIADLALPDSSRWKGAGMGLAAGIKLTPLIFVPYLLASRRVRVGLVALLAFAATVAIGFAVLPAASQDYWAGRFAVYRGTGQLVNQSVNGVVQRLLHGHPPAHAVWLALAIIVVIAGLATAVLASRRGLELLGVVLCGVTALLASPLSWTHHWVWVLPGLTLMAAGSGRSGVRRSTVARGGRDGSAGGSPGACDQVGGAAGSGPAGICSLNWIWRAAGTAVIVALFVAWPIPQRAGHITEWLPAGFLRLAPYGQHQVYTWHGATLLLGNSYVIAGAAAIAGTAGYLWFTRGRQRELVAIAGQPDRSPPRSGQLKRGGSLD
jgi:alpha-1,2-mannosyltransferase